MRLRQFCFATPLALSLLLSQAGTASAQEVAISSPAPASERPAIHFHSILQNSEGEPLSGVHVLTFYIHDNADKMGSPLWRETLSIRSDAAGQYSVDLATQAPRSFVQSELLSHKKLYVSTNVLGSMATTAATIITTIPQGIWLNCNPDNTSGNCDTGQTINSETAMAQIGTGHFRYALNADNWWGTKAQISTYAAQASTSGVKIIWYLGYDFLEYLSTSTSKYSLQANDTELGTSFCSKCTNLAFTTAVVNFIKTLPATAGYLIDDEAIQNNMSGYPLSSSDKKKATAIGNEIAALSAAVKAADPDHPIFGTEDYADVNNASEAEMATYYSYIPAGTLNYIGSDYYPVGSLATLPTNAQLTTDQKNASDSVESITTSQKATGTFEDLQAYNWADSWEGGCQTSGYTCAFPTVAQLQDMLTGAVSSITPPAQIFWWEYPDVIYNGQWNDLLTAANPQ
jgi:hypothetical protein